MKRRQTSAKRKFIVQFCSQTFCHISYASIITSRERLDQFPINHSSALLHRFPSHVLLHSADLALDLDRLFGTTLFGVFSIFSVKCDRLSSATHFYDYDFNCDCSVRLKWKFNKSCPKSFGKSATLPFTAENALSWIIVTFVWK